MLSSSSSVLVFKEWENTESLYSMQTCPCTKLKKWLYAKAILTVFAAEEFNSHTVSQSTPCQRKNTNILSFDSWKPVGHYRVAVLVTCKILQKALESCYL